MGDYAIDLGLQGKVAIVTGGARNIGRATAAALARCGASVGIIARNDSEDLAAAVRECEKYAPSVGKAVDIADASALRDAINEIGAALGQPAILVNNAAVRPRVKLAEITVEDFDQVVATNLRAPFLASQQVLPAMTTQRWGRIINVSGIDAINGSIDRVHVTTSKSGLLGLTAALAPGLAKYGVTVNTVVPGAIDTVRHTPQWYPEYSAFHAGNINRFPMARFGSPGEVASVIVFLASDLASYLTGQTIVAAGGYPLARRRESEEEPDLDWVGQQPSLVFGPSAAPDNLAPSRP